jgi:hypothetical protein
MYAGRVCWRVCPGRGAARPGHRAQMASNVIVAHERLSRSGGSIGAHGNLRAGAANARPRRHAGSPGQASQPRSLDARMLLQNFSTCCCLHCGGHGGSKRADLRSARCLAAAFSESDIPQQCRLRRLSKLLHRSGENDKRYRRHHPASQLGPACRYLSLRFQTIQSCSPVSNPIATAVQPWSAQDCAYTLRKHLKPALPCFSIEFAIKRDRWRRPLCKISFLILTPAEV